MTTSQHSAAKHDPDPDRGARTWLPEFLVASLVALIAVSGMLQVIFGERSGNRSSVTTGGNILGLAVFVGIVLGIGYGLGCRRRRLPVERKVDVLTEDVRDLGDGIDRVEEILTDLAEPAQPPAKLYALPRQP